MRRALLSLTSLLLLLPAARGDVVHLTNGREIPGRVVSEDADQVVVKTGAGRLTLRRSEVARVEREGEARTLLREARQAASAGDAATARRLFDAAAGAGDPEVATIAAREREALAARRDDDVREAPVASPRGDPFLEVEREALIRELEAAAATRPDLARRLTFELYQRGRRRHDARECRLAASDFRRASAWASEEQRAPLAGLEAGCRLEVAAVALRRRDPGLARVAAEPVTTHPDLGRRAAYLLGRAEERVGRAIAARTAFRLALGDVTVAVDHDLPTLRELARLAAAGIAVDAETPGVAAAWRCTQTRHFSILHDTPLDPAFSQRLETLRGEVLTRLELRGLDDDARIALFLFAGAEAYQGAPGARAWSAGHAARLSADGEVVPTIYLHVEGDADARLRHELAHILVGDALDDGLLPMWAAEGVAMYAEHEAARRARRADARALRARGELRPVRDALGQMLLPLSDDRQEIGRFYAQACLLFDVLASRVGVMRALGAAARVNTAGAEEALRSVGVSLAAFEQAVDEALGSPPR